MAGPPAATAAVRLAVRQCLAGLVGVAGLVAEGEPAASTVYAAVSGGADSLALAAALAFERPGAGALVVDHGLQPGSAQVAERAAGQCRSMGLSVRVLGPGTDIGAGVGRPSRAEGGDGPRGAGGPEARARAMRYGLLDLAAGGAPVLLGHTLDDQAETVLLGLARGSGGRALAGMASVRGPYRRPLLSLTRSTTRAACAEAGLVPHDDPHNLDARFRRVRARATVLPVLERELGPGVAAALARTARLLGEDADALDALAARVAVDTEPSTEALLQLPAAVRTRVLKRWAEQVCGRAVGAAHVDALRQLVESWRGQGPVHLPGGARAGRRAGRLVVLAAVSTAVGGAVTTSGGSRSAEREHPAVRVRR